MPENQERGNSKFPQGENLSEETNAKQYDESYDPETELEDYRGFAPGQVVRLKEIWRHDAFRRHPWLDGQEPFILKKIYKSGQYGAAFVIETYKGDYLVLPPNRFEQCGPEEELESYEGFVPERVVRLQEVFKKDFLVRHEYLHGHEESLILKKIYRGGQHGPMFAIETQKGDRLVLPGVMFKHF